MTERPVPPHYVRVIPTAEELQRARQGAADAGLFYKGWAYGHEVFLRGTEAVGTRGTLWVLNHDQLAHIDTLPIASLR